MDEPVEDGVSGILVPVRSETRAPYHLVTASRATTEELEQAIRRVQQMSERQRLEMGLRARALFEHDWAQFHARIRGFFEAYTGLPPADG